MIPGELITVLMPTAYAWIADDLQFFRFSGGHQRSFCLARRALQRLHRQFFTLGLCLAHTSPPV